MNLNVNFNTPTIEKVIQKRWTIVEEIMTNLQDGMRAQLSEADGDAKRSAVADAASYHCCPMQTCTNTVCS